jgi:hypothetical protein
MKEFLLHLKYYCVASMLMLTNVVRSLFDVEGAGENQEFP